MKTKMLFKSEYGYIIEIGNKWYRMDLILGTFQEVDLYMDNNSNVIRK